MSIFCCLVDSINHREYNSGLSGPNSTDEGSYGSGLYAGSTSGRAYLKLWIPFSENDFFDAIGNLCGTSLVGAPQKNCLAVM